ncbi:MAG: tetratricopeptide repeat protein [Acidobacteriia bacterium]|nr:tetratricopeptide repeat protein [Terriglobia bacterium]
MFRKALEEGIRFAADGRADHAIRVLDAALRLAVEGGEKNWASLIARNLAVICEHENQLDRAIDCLRSVVDRVPDDRRILFQLGTLYERAGKPEEAAAAFRASLQLSKENQDGDLLELLDARGYRPT